MLTFSGRRNLYGSLTNDSSTENLTLGDTLMMDAERSIAAMRPWVFLESTHTFSTVASQQFYNLPNDLGQVIAAPSTTIGGHKYIPSLAATHQMWDQINVNTNVTSDFPQWYYIYNNQIGFWPIPSSTTPSVGVPYRKKPVDLVKTDYSTGTITTLAAAGTAVTGSGTTWTAGMVGMFIRITSSTAANVGDGAWYKISAIGSTTTLTIDRPYQGTAIAAGSAAYTIGQASVLPEEFDVMPAYKAAEIYFTTVQPDVTRARLFKDLYDSKLKEMEDSAGSKTDDPLIEGDKLMLSNPNLTVFY